MVTLWNGRRPGRGLLLEIRIQGLSFLAPRRQVALGCARSISADDDLESMFHYFAVGGRKDPLQLSPKETKTQVNFENTEPTKPFLFSKKTRLKLLRNLYRHQESYIGSCKRVVRSVEVCLSQSEQKYTGTLPWRLK